MEQALLQSNDALRLLSETANELLSSDRPQAVIKTLFEKLSARLGLEAFFNYLVDEEKGRLHLNAYAGIPPQTAQEIEWLEYGQAVCGCVARDGSKIVAEDIQHSADVRTDLVRSFGISVYACHPLIARGKVVGTFSFGTTKKPYFEPHELALMQAVCDQVSMAMERTLLIADLRRRESAQRLLADASALLGSSLDYEETLAGFARLLASNLADWCVVDLAAAHGQARWVALAEGEARDPLLAAELEQYQLLALDEVQALQRVAGSGRAELYSEASEAALATFAGNAREQRRLAELGVRSLLTVPLSGRSRVLGTLTLVTASSGRHYNVEDLALANELAYRAAIAADNAALYRAARQAADMREEFFAVAAHELKTPVTNLRGFAQALVRQHEQGREIDQTRLSRALQVIDQQSAKLANLVSQLLDMSVIDAGRLVLERKSLEIGELARRVVDGVQTASPNHQLALRVHEPVWIQADPFRLEQVLRNLLDNAVKFSPRGSKIDVEIWSPDMGTVKLAVRDRGTGIPPQHRERVFDRFYRAHVDDHSSGMGIGLYLCRHLIELHGGTIELEAPVDGGTRVVVSLPTALAEVKRHLGDAQRGDRP